LPVRAVTSPDAKQARIDDLEVRNAKLEAVAYLREHGFPTPGSATTTLNWPIA
jgi:hypothetical protein